METKVRWIIERLGKSGGNTKKEVRDYFKNMTIEGINELINDLAQIAYIMEAKKFNTIQDFHTAYDEQLKKIDQTIDESVSEYVRVCKEEGKDENKNDKIQVKENRV